MNHHQKIGVILQNHFLFYERQFLWFFLAITFCVIGKACSNTRLLAALDDRYAYECLHDEEQIHRTLSECKQLLSKRQLRIYVMESFEENLFYHLKEDENTYIISAELVLTCAEKKMVTIIFIDKKTKTKFDEYLGYTCSTKKSSIICSTSFFSYYLFCWWYSSRNSCKSIDHYDKGEMNVYFFFLRRNSVILFIISVDQFEKIMVIK